jgi:predicted nuclease of predicted toxin-antitoxin system
MRFKVDENMPTESADVLKRAGHDAETVLEEQLGGKPDPMPASVCKAEERAIVTLDLDFADIRTYPPAEYHGIIVIRSRNQAKSHVLRLLQMATHRIPSEELTGKLWIVDEADIRIHDGKP